MPATTPAAPPEEPLDEPTAIRLVGLARALKAAARAVTLYPPEHPAIGNALARLLEAGVAATADGPFSLNVHPDTLTVQGRAIHRPDSAVGELAAILHQILVGQLTVNSGLDAGHWRQFLTLITTPAEAIRAQGGPAEVWATSGDPRIAIREIDYSEMLRERQAGGAATWDRVIAMALRNPVFDLDDESLRALGDTAADPAALTEFSRRIAERITGPGAAKARAAVLGRALEQMLAFLREQDPSRIPAVLDNTAAALCGLPEDIVTALVVRWAEAGSDPERGALLEQVANRMPPPKLGEFVAGSVASHRGASARLADVLRCLVPEAESRRQVLDHARESLEQSPLAADPAFDEMWARASELLASQADRAWAPESYHQELDTVRSQAAEVEKIADDPPERVAAWLTTVTDTAVRALDVQLLLDLLRLDATPERWREIAQVIVAHTNDLILIGDFAAARQLVEALNAQKGTAGDLDRVQWVIAAIDTLVAGQTPGHLASHLQAISAEELDEVKRLAGAIGTSLVTPLAEAVAVEPRPRVRQRMTDVLLAFGAEGRRSVQSLMQSSTAAVRRTAVQLLRQFGGSDAIRDLTALLDDCEAAVRNEAVRAMLTIGSDEAYAVLERALTSGGQRPRDAVLDELATLRDERAVPLFCYLIRHTDHRGPSEDLYLMVLARLGSLGGPEAVETLKTVLYRGQWWAPGRTARFREAAARALAKIPDPEARRVLDEAAAGGPRGVRAAVRMVAR